MSDEIRMTLLHHSTNDLIEQLLMWRGLAAEHFARIAELEEAQRWIPVGERLPEDGDFVLIWDEMNGVYIAEHSKQVPQWAADGYYRHGTSYKYITHWMPLPQPPEVK